MNAKKCVLLIGLFPILAQCVSVAAPMIIENVPLTLNLGTATGTPPTTTTVECGDGFCDPGENYLFCPKDCPSGGGDRYCDGLEDGVCDPDCRPEADPDCIVGEASLDLTTALAVVVLIISLAVIVIIYVMYRRGKDRGKDDKATIEWLRGELGDGENPETLRGLLEEGGYDPGLLDKAMKEMET